MDPEKLTAGHRDALQALGADSVTREVVVRMRTIGIEPVLLKGPVTAAWLYPHELRSYNDSDLLVHPDRQDEAAQALRQIGFRHLETGESVNEKDDHSRTFVRGGAEVDLHHGLSGTHVSAGTAWSLLTRDLSSLEVSGLEMTTLGPVARTLHIVLHAADSGGKAERTRADLDRAMAATPQSLWAEIVELARGLEAMPAFVAGLRQVPSGAALLATLQVHESPTPYHLLRAANDVPAALGVARLLSLPVARWPGELVREVAPSPAFMRLWSPLARRGKAGLALAYAYRPLWLLGRLPAAYAAYRRARQH